jgi:hypothetical protein
VYPLDVVKTRMQVEPSRWPGAFSCAADTLRDGGVRGLYAGMGAQMVGVAPEKSFKVRCASPRRAPRAPYPRAAPWHANARALLWRLQPR